MARRFPNSNFTGIDINPDLVKWGNEYLEKSAQTNCRLVESDLYNMEQSHFGRYDGVVSFQTLSWLPEYKMPACGDMIAIGLSSMEGGLAISKK